MTAQDEKRVREIERKLDAALDRLARHSAYIMDDVLPRLDLFESRLDKVWVSDRKFKETEQAIADTRLDVAEIVKAVFEGRGRPRPRRN